MLRHRTATLCGLACVAVACGNGASTSEPAAEPDVPTSAAPIHFSDVTASAGASTARAAAIAFVDLDDDGRPDLAVGTVLGLYVLMNTGGGKFVDHSWRVPPVPEVTALAAADLDGDGHLDLYASRMRFPDVILRGDGTGGFEILPAVGIPDAVGSTGVAIADFDSDGDLDVFVCIGRDPALERRGGGGVGAPDLLLRNDGDRFTDVAATMGVQGGATTETSAAVWADFDQDGDLDLVTATAFEPDHLYRNPGDGGPFADEPIPPAPRPITNVVGLTVADFDGDGRLDVYGTDAEEDSLYLGMPDGSLRASFLQALDGAPDPTASKTSEGCAFLDADNDGDPDVVTVADDDLYYRSGPKRLGGFVFFANDGAGHLVDATRDAGEVFGPAAQGHGIAIADYDLDGDIDIAVALIGPDDVRAPDRPVGAGMGLLLLQNDGRLAQTHRALNLDLRQDGGNRWAIGSTVTVFANGRQTSRVVTAGEGYLSASDLRLHFGLGEAKAASVRVRWPDGRVDELPDLAAGRWVIRRQSDTCCDVSAPPAAAPPTAPPPCEGTCALCQDICARAQTCADAPTLLRFAGSHCPMACHTLVPAAHAAQCAATASCAELAACIGPDLVRRAPDDGPQQ